MPAKQPTAVPSRHRHRHWNTRLHSGSAVVYAINQRSVIAGPVTDDRRAGRWVAGHMAARRLCIGSQKLQSAVRRQRPVLDPSTSSAAGHFPLFSVDMAMCILLGSILFRRRSTLAAWRPGGFRSTPSQLPRLSPQDLFLGREAGPGSLVALARHQPGGIYLPPMLPTAEPRLRETGEQYGGWHIRSAASM